MFCGGAETAVWRLVSVAVTCQGAKSTRGGSCVGSGLLREVGGLLAAAVPAGGPSLCLARVPLGGLQGVALPS